MILTQCAVCATDLGLTLGKKCGRCSTRYCGAACQVQHWKEGGHDNLCKKIKKAGGAEQYNANTKYAEAVAVAAEACAEDTKGQTCYICTQALHWKTKEGLVRGCSCRGTAGFVHVSCLAEQAKILLAEAEENNLDTKKWDRRWFECSLCEQFYHGVVQCALGWACWKTYVGRPEADGLRCMAMTQLGNGLSAADHEEDALSVQEAELAMERRLGASEETILIVQSNLGGTYQALGRLEEALRLSRDVYSGRLRLDGGQARSTFLAAGNYAMNLIELRRFAEARNLLRKIIPVARRVLGNDHELTLSLREDLCRAILDGEPTDNEKHEALEMLKDTAGAMRRILGPDHPDTLHAQKMLKFYGEKDGESVEQSS
jgi:tetratricopeptide (TPR) repeat protein